MGAQQSWRLLSPGGQTEGHVDTNKILVRSECPGSLPEPFLRKYLLGVCEIPDFLKGRQQYVKGQTRRSSFSLRSNRLHKTLLFDKLQETVPEGAGKAATQFGELAGEEGMPLWGNPSGLPALGAIWPSPLQALSPAPLLGRSPPGHRKTLPSPHPVSLAVPSPSITGDGHT